MGMALEPTNPSAQHCSNPPRATAPTADCMRQKHPNLTTAIILTMATLGIIAAIVVAVSP